MKQLLPRFLFTGFLLLVFPCLILAQVNDIPLLRFNKPLSQNTGTCIFQDHIGFLWIGTTNGLNRYDGMEVTIYENDSKDSSSISNNFIRSIAEAKNGDLWIATENGLNRYDRASNRFVRYYYQPENDFSLSSNNISDVVIDRQGRVWAAAGDLCCYRPDINNFVRYPAGTNQDGNSLLQYHNFIYQDHTGDIWYGYWRDLYCFNPKSEKLEIQIRGEVQIRGDADWHLHELLEDRDGYFWLATNKAGLLRFHAGEKNPEPEIFSDDIGENESFSDYRLLKLFLDHDNNLWVSCENTGLVVLDRNRKITHRLYNVPDNERSISGNSVWSIFEDDQHRMWFGIWNAGISFYDPFNVQFQHYHSSKGTSNISNNIVTDFLEDNEGNIWIATDGGGLNYFDRQKSRFSSYKHDPADPNSISSNAVLSLCYDDKGNVWAGTYNGGIDVLNPQGNRFLHFNQENSSLTSDNVFDLLNDGAGNIYIATWGGGLNIFHQPTKKWENYTANPTDPNSLSDNNIFVLYRDKQNEIWVGTVDGLNLLRRFGEDKGHFWRYQYFPNIANGISDNRIQTIYEDKQGRFWVGTSNGLNLMDRKAGTFEVYRHADGLYTNYISGIIADDQDNLWVSTLKGITRIDSTFKVVHHYDISDNLQGDQFNRNAVFKTSRGELLFGGTNGFNLIQPEDIRNNPYPPRIVLTDLKISNKSVPSGWEGILQKEINETQHLMLSYKHTVFSLEFVALNFTHPEKNQYAYMMQGFETDWNYSGTQNNATYTNLDAGDYIFRVKAANNDAVWNEAGLALKITITPPFWKTRWAYILYLLMIVLAFYFAMRYQLRQERLRHELEMEHMKLEKLSEIDKIKSRFFSNVSHEIRTPIMLIVGPLENLLKSDKVIATVKNKLRLIIRNAQRLSRMMNQLVDYYKIESPALKLNLAKNNIVEFVRNIFLSFKEYARDHKIRFRFETNMEQGYTWFDGDKIDKIIYNLLSNAFKFTPDGGEVVLGLNYRASDSQSQNYIEIFVRDTGIGIPGDQQDLIFERFYQVGIEEWTQAEGIGIGLNMTLELVDLQQGEIKVESEPGQGTLFRIILPMDIIDLQQPQLSPVDAQDAGNELLPFQATPQENQDTGEGTALILLVDDEIDVQQYIQDIFSERFKIITAGDGEEGFEKAMEFVPDLIISDVIMPRMDGYKMCEQLKSKEQTSHIPVILLTVQSEAEQKLKGIKLGADEYIPKPFDRDELEARVINLLESRRKLREMYRRRSLLEPKDDTVLSLDEKFLLRVKQEVEKNLADWKLNAYMLSNDVGVSRIQLYRKIKGLTGQTVHEFIRSVRLRRAVQLLEQRKMKVTEIAFHVGFNDLNYFSRCFRKQYGLSPSEFSSSKTGRDLLTG